MDKNTLKRLKKLNELQSSFSIDNPGLRRAIEFKKNMQALSEKITQDYNTFRPALAGLERLALDVKRIQFQIPQYFIDAIYESQIHTQNINDVLKTLNLTTQNLQLPFQKIVEQQRSIQKMHGNLQNAIQKMYVNEYSELIENITLPAVRINDAFNSIRALTESIKPPFELIQSAFQIPLAYQNFVLYQLEKAEKDEDEIRDRRLVITDLAGDLMDNCQIVIENAMIVAEKSALESEGEVASNLFNSLNQNLFYLYRSGCKFDPILYFNASKTANINVFGCNICEQVFKINKLEETSTGKCIFKNTTKNSRANMIIPSRVANIEENFGIIIDNLYFLLYEGSGDAKRLTSLLTDNELETLWLIKHLRRDFRHDVDHGKESDIIKKMMSPKDFFMESISKPYPSTNFDWSTAQLFLYEKVYDMLCLLQENIEMKYTNN